MQSFAGIAVDDTIHVYVVWVRQPGEASCGTNEIARISFPSRQNSFSKGSNSVSISAKCNNVNNKAIINISMPMM